MDTLIRLSIKPQVAIPKIHQFPPGCKHPQGKVLVRAHTDRNLRPQPISHFSFLISNS